MQYILLFAVVIGMATQNVGQKQYSAKAKKHNQLLFSAILTFCAMVFFFVSAKFKLSFNRELIPYAIAVALSYGGATVGSVYAIGSGPLSITLLITSYSLIIPTLYGIVAFDDKLKTVGIVGIIFLLISLYLINVKKENMKFSPKWIFWVLVCFFGNGICSTTQKIQQTHFNGEYKSEFMILALVILTISLFIAGCKNSTDLKKEIISCCVYAPIVGISNGVVNLLVMLLTARMPNAILFPTITAGGIVVSFIIALVFYKERLSKTQVVGYILGVFSVVMMNL